MSTTALICCSLKATPVSFLDVDERKSKPPPALPSARRTSASAARDSAAQMSSKALSSALGGSSSACCSSTYSAQTRGVNHISNALGGGAHLDVRHRAEQLDELAADRVLELGDVLGITEKEMEAGKVLGEDAQGKWYVVG